MTHSVEIVFAVLLMSLFAVMADRKGKTVTPMKKLTKKEKEEFKKNVSGSRSSVFRIKEFW